MPTLQKLQKLVYVVFVGSLWPYWLAMTIIQFQ